MQAQRAPLPGGRWHFQHGPIDLVIGAEGPAAQEAHEAAWRRFEGVLVELVGELPRLREAVAGECRLHGPVARRMWLACVPFADVFITPMAAVAGSVAQELIAFYSRPGITRAWVNNGGDIALHLAPGSSARVGLFADLSRLDPSAIHTDGQFEIRAESPVRGLATSGWRGRSHSLGIADSVTVLATSAAQADAAATIIANAVDLDDPRILRRPARELKDDTDLGDIAVTVEVPELETRQLDAALAAGEGKARMLQSRGLIHSAFLVCQHRALAVAPSGARATAVGSVFA